MSGTATWLPLRGCQRPPPPTSAGRGGGSGVVDVEVVLVAVVDVVGAEDVDVVVDVDVVDDVVDDDCEVAGPWKSTQDSLRTTLPPELTVSELELTV